MKTQAEMFIKKAHVFLFAALVIPVCLPAHATTTVTVDNGNQVTVTQIGQVQEAVIPAENPKDFEGVIIRVDLSKSQIVVQDTTGRERRVQLKQGMIGTYKVDDYVRVHLMADLKEAKTIETVRGVRNLEGRIVNVDPPRDVIVVRGNDGKDSTVILRQGQIARYRTGDPVRIYLLADNEEVQVIRFIR